MASHIGRINACRNAFLIYAMVARVHMLGDFLRNVVPMISKVVSDQSHLFPIAESRKSSQY